jgi:protein-tyrosine phosphatase
MILSAGVAAVAGGHASPEAVAAIQAWGLDLTNHETRAVTDVLVRFADLILTMTRGHRDALLEEWPEAAARVALVCRDQHDVADPIGGSLDVYRRCAEQLDRQLTEWAKQIQSESLPRLQVA